MKSSDSAPPLTPNRTLDELAKKRLTIPGEPNEKGE
jgi:hypothetical protein